MQAHTSRKRQKTRVRLFLRAVALRLSQCVSCNARKISRTCTTVLQEHHQKTSKFLSTLQLGISDRKQTVFKVQPLQTNRFLASTGFFRLGFSKPVLDFTWTQWRFRVMKPYLPHVGSSLTPSEGPDPQIDPSRASLTPNLLTNNLPRVVHVKYS